MPTCPKCRQAIDSQVITCPYCRTALKAYGHPGIPLYRAEGQTYLCDNCTYHEDDSCNFPQRPYAKECTLYHDRHQPIVPLPQRSTQRSPKLPLFLRQREGWLILVGLMAISILIVLAKQS